MKQVAGGSSDSSGESFDGYEGTLSGQISVNSAGVQPCTFTRAITGTIRIEMFSGNSMGRATVAITQNPISVSGSPTCIGESTPVNFTLLR